MSRTYAKADWLAGQAAWSDFGPRWQRIRSLSSEWTAYPPAGSAHDDRDSESPSQRAIIWRAIEDNPGETEAIVRRCRSWSGVVDRIIGLESRLRTDADLADRDREWDRDEPTYPEAVKSLASILERIGDSA